MTDLRQQTVDTYNKSAEQFADYFAGIGSREKDIDRALKLAGNLKNPNVLELGCGDGRDAAAILKRTPSYLGIDISESFIDIARKNLPQGKFGVADMAAYAFEEKLDIIFAFASLLHLNKNEVATVLTRAAKSLKPGGIFYISLKYKQKYEQELKEDQFGKRLFYFYNPEIIAELATGAYKVAKTWREIHGHTEWFEIALRKT